MPKRGLGWSWCRVRTDGKDWRLLLSLALVASSTPACRKNQQNVQALIQAPKTGVVQPQSGAGATALFTAKYYQSGGVDKLDNVRLLVNSELNGGRGCYVYYSVASGSFLLINDEGNGSSALPQGSDGRLENGQCIVGWQGASVQETDEELTVVYSVRFKSTFAGKRNIYLYAENKNGQNSDFSLAGTWDIGDAR